MKTKESPSSIIHWLYNSQKSYGINWCNYDHAAQILQPADVILVNGTAPADKRIKAITESQWSQALLYLGRLHDIKDPSLRAMASDYLPCQSNTQLLLKVDLVHGVHLITLSELQDAQLRICRPSGLTDNEKQSVIRYSLSRLESHKKHAWWPAIRLLLVPWSLFPRHWRKPIFKLLAGRRLRRAVGGTVGDSFSFIQFPVLPLVKQESGGKTKLYRHYPMVFYPSDFDLSPYFDVLKYPFADQIDGKGLRLLPWKGEIGALQKTGDGAQSATAEPAPSANVTMLKP